MVYLSAPKLVHLPPRTPSEWMCVFLYVWVEYDLSCQSVKSTSTHTHTHTYTQERYTLYSTVTMEMLGSFKGLHLHNGNCIYRCRPAVIHIKCSRLKLSMTNHGFSQLVVTVCMFDQEISEVDSEQYLKVCKLCRYSCRMHYINFRRSAFAFSIYKDNCVIYKSSRYNW